VKYAAKIQYGNKVLLIKIKGLSPGFTGAGVGKIKGLSPGFSEGKP
jgi:hypothetical protein